MIVKKPRTRKERLQFLEKKKGRRGMEIFLYATDKEVKSFFELLYPSLKDKPDATADDTVQCLRCGCDVEHHLECGCGINRCVFTEQEWKDDIEGENWSDRKNADFCFIENGYKVPDYIRE